MTTAESLKNALDNTTQISPSVTGGRIASLQELNPAQLIFAETDRRNAAYVDDIEEIYPNSSALLSGTIKLLSEVIEDCTSALQEEDRHHTLAADDFMQRVQATLPLLFERRELGDGFGIIINAVRFAFINKEGSPFSRPEIQSLVRIFKQVRSHPFVGIEAAVEGTEVLENSGLCVDPTALGVLLNDAEESGIASGE